MSTLQFDAQKWPRQGTPFADVTNARDLAAMMMSRAQNQLKRMGTQKTSLLFLTEDEVHMVVTPLSEKEQERIAVGNLALKMAHDLGAFAAGMVSESWLIPGVTEVGDDPTRLLHNENKIEMLLVTVTWDGQEPAAKALEIVREPGKSPTFARRDDLITPDGVDGVFVLKQKQKSLSAQVLKLPIPV